MNSTKHMQTALKLGLLAILAANVSYHPFSGPTGETNLSATEPQPPAAPASAGTAAQAPAPAAPVAAKLATTVRQPETKEVETLFSVCGGKNRYKVIYKSQDSRTDASVQSLEADCRGCQVNVAAGANSSFSAAVQEETENKLRPILEKAAGCEEKRQAKTDDKTNKELDAERKENELKVKRCELKKEGSGKDAKYVALDDDEEILKCNIARLSRIEFEKDLKKSELTSTVEKLINEKLRKPIKAKLSSKDEAKYDEGRTMSEEVIDALKELDIDSRRKDRLIGLFQGYRAGGETARKSREFEDDTKDVRNRLADAREEARRYPSIESAANLRAAMYDHSMLANDINNEIAYGPLRTMDVLRRQGYLQTSDISEFMRPYETIRRDMMDMIRVGNTGTLGNGLRRTYSGLDELAIPTDLYSLRSSTDRGFNRRAGYDNFPSVFSRPTFSSSSLPGLSFGESRLGLGLDSRLGRP